MFFIGLSHEDTSRSSLKIYNLQDLAYLGEKQKVTMFCQVVLFSRNLSKYSTSQLQSNEGLQVAHESLAFYHHVTCDLHLRFTFKMDHSHMYYSQVTTYIHS